MDEVRSILHVDMDAFYASVEQKDDPSLVGKPVIVGGAADRRGVVSACSYEARKYNVRSAMPMGQALKLCPDAVVMPVRMKRYAEVSQAVHEVFHNYTPDVEKLSIDEAFLDVTGCRKLFGDAETIGRKVKAEILAKTGLTASVGVAPNKFLAKLASDLDKPNGFVVITEENKQAILDPLEVAKIWGIGKVTCEALKRIGVVTVKQMRMTPKETLKLVFKNRVDEILQLACGIDDRPVVTDSEAKSFSAENTFAKNIADRDTLLAVLQEQVEEVSQRLRAEHLQARTITMKFRYGDFQTVTRSVTLDKGTNVTQILLRHARRIFDKWYSRSGAALRLIGFGMSSLSAEGSGQMMLFSDPEEEKYKKVDAVMDEIKDKFGNDVMKRGTKENR